MTFEVCYHEAVMREDIPAISYAARQVIRGAIEKKLTTYPDLFGKPLRRSLKGYRKLRVGDYRVVFRIEGAAVKVLVIAHRARVYRIAGKRV